MSPTPRGARFGAYHRVSSTAGRDVDSEAYITERDAFGQIDAWAKFRGITIAKRYLDRDVSGSTMHRPALDELMDDLRTGVIEGVVVAYVDRLSRADVGDALAVVHEIGELAPGGLAALDLGVDPTTEFGEFGLTVLLALARLQWRRHKRGRDRVRELAVARGAFCGPTPIGYKRDDAGRLVPDDADGGTAGYVREAFRRAASGKGGDVAQAMEYLRVMLPVRIWNATTVRRVLTSRVYLGESNHGTYANDDAHAALVTFTQWTAAQPNGKRPYTPGGAYSLSGLARCGTCGGPLIGQTVRRPTSNGVTTRRRYRCSNRGNNRALCAHGALVAAADLETYVLDGLRDVLADGAMLDAGLPAAGLAAAQAALDVAEDERREFAADIEAQRALGRAAWLTALHDRRRAVEHATAALQDELALAATRDAVPALDDLDDLDDADRARVLRSIIERITVAPGRAPLDERVVITIAGLDDAHDATGMATA